MKNKFKIILLIIITTLNVIMLNAQITFSHVYGGGGYDYGYAVTQTYDSGYVVAGATTSFGNGSTDAYILKTDSLGNVIWQKTFGGINIDQAFSVKQTRDSGLVIAGYTNSFGHGGYDMYVIKTNKLGDTVWTKTYGGSNWDFAYSIDTTTDGGYIIAGGTYSYGKGNEDMYLIKINSSGDTTWTKTYGGINDDEIKSVKHTSDGGYILTGSTKSFGDTNGDIYTIKTNDMGDTLWTYRYAGAQEDYSYDVIERANGSFVIVGKTNSTNLGGFDCISLYFTNAGVLGYTSIDGGNQDDGFNSIVENPSGFLGIVGYTGSYGYANGSSDFYMFVLNNTFHGPTLLNTVAK